MSPKFLLPQGVQWDETADCTPAREQFIKNQVSYLTFYSLMSMYGEIGHTRLHQTIKQKGGNDQTRVRLSLNGYVYEGTTEELSENYSGTLQELGHLILIAQYGGLEAYLVSLILDVGRVDTSFSAENFLRERFSRRSWRARLNNLTLYLKLPLGENVFKDAFGNADMVFHTERFTNPLDFLAFITKLRNLLVHNGGRIDQEFKNLYPSVVFTEDKINIAFGFPNQIGLFFLHMSAVVDKAFSEKFGIKTTTVKLGSI